MATRTTKHLNRVAAPGLTSTDLLALILKEQTRDVDAVPEGWLTAQQWGEKWNLSSNRTGELLKYAVEKGLCEVRKFRITTGAKVYPVPHYRQKGP